MYHLPLELTAKIWKNHFIGNNYSEVLGGLVFWGASVCVGRGLFFQGASVSETFSNADNMRYYTLLSWHMYNCIYYVADAVYEMKMFMFCVQWWTSSNILQKYMAAVVDNKNQNIGVFVAKCGEYSATV